MKLILSCRLGCGDFTAEGIAVAGRELAFEFPGEVFRLRRHHIVTLSGVAAVKSQAAALVADGHGVVAEHLVDVLVIADRDDRIGDFAYDVDISRLTGPDIERLAALEPAVVERSGHRVAGPCLGYITA